MAYTTFREHEFLDQLGTLKEEGVQMARYQLLKRYAKAMVNRHDWGSIDRKEIEARVKSELGED